MLDMECSCKLGQLPQSRALSGRRGLFGDAVVVGLNWWLNLTHSTSCCWHLRRDSVMLISSGSRLRAVSRNAACDHKNQEILNIFGWIF